MPSRWRVKFFPFDITVTKVESIALVYVAFNVVCFVLGIAFVFLGGVLTSLGVAMIVGALFSFGAFWAQIWAISMQKDNNIVIQALKSKELEDLLKRYVEISRRIAELRKDES